MNKEIQFIIFTLLAASFLLIAYFCRNKSYIVQAAIAVCMLAVLLWAYSNRTLGMDWVNYRKEYDTSSLSDLAQKFRLKKIFSNQYEPLFLLMMYVAKQFGFTFPMFLILVYAVPILVFGSAILGSESPLTYFSVFFLLMMFNFDLTRAIVAIAFVYLAYHARHRAFKIVFYLLAIGFHYSSFLALLLEIIVSFRKKKLYKPLVVAGTALLVPLRFLNPKVLNYSRLSFISKAQYYLFHTETLDDPFLLNVCYVLINVFPVVFCFWLIIRFDAYYAPLRRNRENPARYAFESDPSARLCVEDEQVDKDKHYLALCTIASLVFLLIFGSIQGSFRIVFLSFFVVFTLFGKVLSVNWSKKTIKFPGVSAVVLLVLCNLWMSLYYVLAFYYY